MAESVQLRWLMRRDLERVLEIERACFEHPWTEDDFLGCMRQRSVISLVAERADRVVAYTLYELQRRHLHVLNLAVDPDARRQGIGATLVAKLYGKLRPPRVRLCVRVWEKNLGAQLFFRAQGFRAIHVCRGAYEDHTGDAYVFERRLPRGSAAEWH